MPIPSLSSKFVSSDKIFSSKADESTSHMMPKPAFVKEINDDDNDTDFQLAFYVGIFFAGDNQTQGLVMGRNVAGPPSEQGLSKAESSKKRQLIE